MKDYKENYEDLKKIKDKEQKSQEYNEEKLKNNCNVPQKEIKQNKEDDKQEITQEKIRLEYEELQKEKENFKKEKENSKKERGKY